MMMQRCCVFFRYFYVFSAKRKSLAHECAIWQNLKRVLAESLFLDFATVVIECRVSRYLRCVC